MSTASLQLSRPRILPFYNGRQLSKTVPMFLHGSHMGFIRARTILSPKFSVSMCLNQGSTKTPGFDANTSLRYADAGQIADGPLKSSQTGEASHVKISSDIHVNKEAVSQQRKGAKIHDFCLGIPFGGFVFGAGLLGLLLSRNPAHITTELLSGGAILALSSISLKVWRSGKSSLPFILGQAAIAAVLLWKNFQVYSLTKQLFPTGIYMLTSAAMFCFYAYVMICGGNPPPKKLAAVPPS